MIRFRRVLAPAPHPLGGGRSVAAWRRAVGCEASRLSRVRRSCAWLRELASATVSLRECDLHGTLPELVAGLGGTSRVEPQAARTAMPLEPGARGLRSRAAAPPWRGLVARTAPGSASGRPARATRRLVTPRSGGARGRDAAAPAPRVTARRREPEPPRAQGGAERASPPGVAPRPSAASKLGAALAGRVHGRLDAAASESIAVPRRPASLGGPPAVRAGRARIVATRPSPADVALAAQWAAGLVGPAASTVLLAGLLQGTDGAGPAVSPEPGANEPAAPDAAPSSGRRADAARDDRLLQRRAPAAAVPPPPPLVAAPPPAASGPPRALSTEVPARGLGAPAEAAARIRLAAAAEGPAADDLGPLAAKLRRILAEEARRHGIDV
jgi:hypothetical protein